MRKKFLSAFMLGALTLAATSTFVSCKDYDGDISALKSDVNALQTKLNELKSAHEADIQALNTQIANAKAELQAAIEKKADKTTVEALALRVENLETRMGAAETRLNAIDAAIKDLQDNKADKSDVQAKYDALTGEINKKLDTATFNEFKSAVEENFRIQGEAIKAAEGRLDDLEEMLSDYPEVKAQVAKNKDDIAALANRMTAAENAISDLDGRLTQAEKDIQANASAIAELKGIVDELSNRITAVEGRLNVLEVLVDKRLTSIYFAPTTFVNGVEAINFAALKYYDWNEGEGKDVENNWLANGPQHTKSNRIDDGTTEAVYYVNPSSVDASSIEGGLAGLSFISNDARNELFDLTRAAEDAPVKVVAEKSTLENGKLTLKLKKNTTESFEFRPTADLGYFADNFKLVSLKAPLSAKAKTAAEANQEINVYSDWARLTETVTVPRIHNNSAEFVYDDAYAIEKPYSHFYAFGEVYSLYGMPTPEGGVYTGAQALKYNRYSKAHATSLVKETVAYDGTIDLKPLVTVCDNEGNIIDYAAFGLSFEFNMPDEFNVLSEGSTTDGTNQQKYAKIADGVVTPCGITGSTKNRDAIDKTPVVQVVLRDKANNAVVDVRYIVLLVTEHEITPQSIGVTIEGKDRFDCGENYFVTVSTDDMNKIAEKLNMTSGLELCKSYTFGTTLYAENGTDIIGTVVKKSHGGAVEQADNLEITFDAANFPLTQDLYDNGSATVKGLVKMYNVYGQYAYYLPVTFTVYFDKSRQNKIKDYARRDNYWTGTGADAYVVCNPTLRQNIDAPSTDYDLSGYFDTQLIYNILNAYHKNNASPANVQAMVDNLTPTDGDDAWFAIDKDRLASVIGAGYSVEDAAGYQLLKKGTEIAAVLWKNTGKIQLYENGTIGTNEIDGAGKHGVPTASAKGFVAYDMATAVADRHNGIPVKIVAKQCGLENDVEKFIVRFEKPHVYTDKKAKVELNDQWDEGSFAEKKWTDWFELQEAFGVKRFIVKKGVDTTEKNLRMWYGYSKGGVTECSETGHNVNWIFPDVKTATIGGIANVVSEATLDGKKLSEYKDASNNPMYVLTYTVSKNETKYGSDAKFSFYNKSGNALTKDITILVPATIKTKWEDYKTTVTVVVKQTATTAKRK